MLHEKTRNEEKKEETGNKSIYSISKIKSIHYLAEFIHHITIPISVVVAIISLLIGLSTSYEWSYKVTGSSEYMMMLFGKLNPEVIILLFAIIILFTLFPLIMGIAASEHVRNDSPKPNFKRRATLSIIMILISIIIPILIISNESPINFKLLGSIHIADSLLLVIIISLFFMFGVCTVFFTYDKPKMNIWTLLVVSGAFLLGGFYGTLILFFDATTSSISHETGFFHTYVRLYILFFAVFVMLFFGIRNGTDYFSVLFTIVSFSLTSSIVLLLLDTPQNVIMRLNNGIVPVYSGLDEGITRAMWREGKPKKYNYQCAYSTMYAINENNETLFSCREKIFNNKNKHVILENKYYRGVLMNKVTHEKIYDYISDKRYKTLVYNINCIRRNDHKFLCEKEIFLPPMESKPTEIIPKKSAFMRSIDVHRGP